MKTFTISTVLALAAAASAQITYNGDAYVCPPSQPNSAFCAGNSLSINIIIRCVNGTAQPANCNDNLAGVPPIGVKTFAPCWQSSPSAGDAACSYNGIAYGNNGSFPIPGASSSSSVSVASSTTSSSVGASSGLPTISVPVLPPKPTGGPAPCYACNSTSSATMTTSSRPYGTVTITPPPPVYTGPPANGAGVVGVSAFFVASGALAAALGLFL